VNQNQLNVLMVWGVAVVAITTVLALGLMGAL